MGETPQRLRDAQGHEWPVTGYWCELCGMPLHRILRAVGVHPTCDVPQTGSIRSVPVPGVNTCDLIAASNQRKGLE